MKAQLVIVVALLACCALQASARPEGTKYEEKCKDAIKEYLPDTFIAKLDITKVFSFLRFGFPGECDQWCKRVGRDFGIQSSHDKFPELCCCLALKEPGSIK